MAHTSIILPVAIREPVERLARQEHRSRSAQIAYLIRRGLVAEGHPDPLAERDARQAAPVSQ